VAAWRGGHRFVPVHTHVRVEEPARDPEGLPPGGAFVLTGGAGTLEMALARKLAASGARGLIFLMCGDEHAEEMAALRAAGAEVLCSPVSPDNPAGLPAVLAEARARFGRLDAVLHTAGSIGGGMIHLKERSAAERVLSPRLDGARLLAGLLRENETLVLFSSAISATGVFGQVDYCAASAFLDAFAQQRRAASGPRVVTVDWGMALWDRWQEAPGPGGAALMEQLREIQSSIGITVDEGVDALWRALSLGEPQVVVCVQDLDALVAQASSSAVAEFLESARPASRAHDAGGSAEAPATDTERAVARAWTDLLGVSPIGRRDNFFELGGNSLLAIQLASGLRKSFGIELSIASLFESADLAATAAAVDRAIADRQSQDEVARLLDEIERLSEQEVLAELERSAETGVAGT
jgi:phthiocerol/phenolphthiocerol synthesis type-I polyketide synthase E